MVCQEGEKLSGGNVVHDDDGNDVNSDDDDDDDDDKKKYSNKTAKDSHLVNCTLLKNK